LAVFLALVFWTWIWGPVGGFLAVPILIISVSVLNHLFFQPEVQLPD
jgi:predicted PurR-regulated permease PerM